MSGPPRTPSTGLPSVGTAAASGEPAAPAKSTGRLPAPSSTSIGLPDGRVIVVGSNKGGIGRTVTAVNLAATLALAGRRTLLVDLDPKGDATAALGLPRDAGSWRGLETLQNPDLFLSGCMSAPLPPGLDVWTGGPALEELQASLYKAEEPPTGLLDQGLQLARRRYRAIVIDCPSTLDPLSCNALGAACVLLLPLSPGTAFSDAAVAETVSMAREVCKRRRHGLEVLGVRLGLREEDLGDRGAPLPPGEGATLDTRIAYDARTLLEATERGVPVFEHAPGSRVARSFLELGREVIARVLEPLPGG